MLLPSVHRLLDASLHLPMTADAPSEDSRTESWRPIRTALRSLPSAEGITRTGEQLRTARENHGLALEECARMLRIPFKMLRALEEGNLSVLPADVYARGFLKQYAEALELDPTPLLREFSQERARFPIPTQSAVWTPHRSSRWKLPLWVFLTRRSLAVLIGGGGLSIILLYVLFNVRAFIRLPQLEVLEPTLNVEARESTITVRGRTDPTAELFINGERTLVHDDGSFSETVGLGEGINTLRVVAKSIGGRENLAIREVLRRSVPTPAASPPVEAPPVIGQTGPFSLTVRAEGEAVWVALAANDHVVFSGVLAPGAEQTVQGERVTITSGKAAKTRILFNGADQGVLGTTPGPLRGITFTRDATAGTIERHESTEVPRD